jgi:hypothetical protein
MIEIVVGVLLFASAICWRVVVVRRRDRLEREWMARMDDEDAERMEQIHAEA